MQELRTIEEAARAVLARQEIQREVAANETLDEGILVADLLEQHRSVIEQRIAIFRDTWETYATTVRYCQGRVLAVSGYDYRHIAAYLATAGMWALTVWLLIGGWDPDNFYLALLPQGLFMAASIMTIVAYRLPGMREAVRSKAAEDLERAETMLVEPRKAYDTALERVVQELLFPVINRASAARFQQQLFVGEAPAQFKATQAQRLSEGDSTDIEVPTAALRRVVEMIRRLPNASIGVSGPRGVGKSTLLRSICLRPPEIDGRIPLTIYTSAPVVYDPRDFLLHLYATLCREVLKRAGLSETGPEDEEPDRRRMVEDHLRAGTILILVSLALAVIGLGLTWALPALLNQSSLKAVAEALKPELKTGALLIWSLIALAGGCALVATGLARKLQRTRIEPAAPRTPRNFMARRTGLMDEQAMRLPNLARSALREIRFQRTVTSGWSGGLKIPTGFELGRNLGVSIAQKQDSLPELVERFRGFVAAAAAEHGHVVIAIDELDKLKSSESAYQFVDEVKSIFSIPNCFYLISVSENAISNFERRGMPFRDAFDSAFDAMLEIGYQTLDEAVALIDRRVINLPRPFLCIAYVLSGGLPRDLIRTTRIVIDQAAERPQENTVRSVAIAVAQDELRRKARAVAVAARTVRLEPEATQFLVAVARLEDMKVEAVLDAELGLVPDPREEPLSGEDAAEFQRLVGLGTELQAFAHFIATAAEVFSDLETEHDWRSAMAQGRIEALAKARQALEVGVGVALFRVHYVRQQAGLRPLPSVLDRPTPKVRKAPTRAAKASTAAT